MALRSLTETPQLYAGTCSPMTEHFKLEPCDIRAVWDDVRPGLEEIKAAWPASNTWRPEDVYAMVVNDDAVLYMTEDGFAVCTIEIDRWTGVRDLFIWLAYSPKDKRGGILKKYWTSFISVAVRLGCAGIQTGSLSPALAAFTEMEPLHTTYRYEIT